MNALTVMAGNAKAMSTKEIADLTGKRHDNVMADARKMLVELHGQDRLLSFQATVERPNPSGGAPIASTVFMLPKRETLVLVSGYSIEMRARIIDRWQELEAGGAVPRTFAQALRLAAEQQEELERQQELLAKQAPKVEFADTMLNADGTTLVRDAAKTIGVPVRKLEKALRDKGVILPNNAPAAVYVTKGYFKESTTTFETRTRGTQLSHTARVTGLGLEFLRRFVARHPDLLGGVT